MDKTEAILERMLFMIESFTQHGMPLPALTFNKREMQTAVILSGMLANPGIASTMLPEEMVEAAISYGVLIDEKLGEVQAPESRIHALERLMRLE
jgi:hypothetical protein